MKIITVSGIVALFVFGWHDPTAHAQNFLFKHPRAGGFKIKQNDSFDFTNAQHFTGSGILAVGFYNLLEKAESRHPKLVAGLLASTVGIVKELEDGYREGWGMKDILFNELGIIAFLLTTQTTHYTLTLKQVVMGVHDYGMGVRFFRSSDISSLKGSLGVYAIRDNHRRTWVGLDSHFIIDRNAEAHFGASMINLNDPNRFEFRPNFGIAFRFY